MVTASPRAHRRLAVKDVTSPELTVGIDVGDRHCVVCVLDEGGEVVEESRVATSERGFQRAFGSRERMRVALEVGTHSAWLSDVLEASGHEVLIANPRDLQRITKNNCKNDRNDAELLARLARSDPKLLSPIRHRDAKLRADLAVIRGRDSLVRTRTQLVNTIRGLVKSAGSRLPRCSTASFHKKAPEHVPETLGPVAKPLFGAIAEITKQIHELDRHIKKLAEEKYPECRQLEQVAGVGTLTALAYVLTIGDPKRFAKSRQAGPYFGLVARQQRSGTIDPQLRITKAGDGLVRRLLVGSSQYVLGRFGPDTDLQRWGASIAARGGKNAKKRAVVAVARKLAVLLHRLWVTGEVYEPLRNANKKPANRGGGERVDSQRDSSPPGI
jgi:transposase